MLLPKAFSVADLLVHDHELAGGLAYGALKHLDALFLDLEHPEDVSKVGVLHLLSVDLLAIELAVESAPASKLLAHGERLVVLAPDVFDLAQKASVRVV